MPQKPPPPAPPRGDDLSFIEQQERDLDRDEARLDFMKSKGLESFWDAFRRIGIAWERSALQVRKERAAAEREFEDQQREGD